MRPPKNAKLPPISLIFRWHESNKPDVVVAGVVGPIMCAGDRSILTRPLRLSIFGNVLIRVIFQQFTQYCQFTSSQQKKTVKVYVIFLYICIYFSFDFYTRLRSEQKSSFSLFFVGYTSATFFAFLFFFSDISTKHSSRNFISAVFLIA